MRRAALVAALTRRVLRASLAARLHQAWMTRRERADYRRRVAQGVAMPVAAACATFARDLEADRDYERQQARRGGR